MGSVEVPWRLWWPWWCCMQVVPLEEAPLEWAEAVMAENMDFGKGF